VDRIARFDVTAGELTSTWIGAAESEASAMRRRAVSAASVSVIVPKTKTVRESPERRDTRAGDAVEALFRV
jgi:hypothetical protein